MKWSLDNLRGLSPLFFQREEFSISGFQPAMLIKTWRVPFGMDTVQFTLGILTLPIVFYVSYGSPSDKNFPQIFQPLATRPDRRNNKKSLENGPEWVFQIAKSLTFHRKFLDGMICFGRWKIQVLVVSKFIFFLWNLGKFCLVHVSVSKSGWHKKKHTNYRNYSPEVQRSSWKIINERQTCPFWVPHYGVNLMDMLAKTRLFHLSSLPKPCAT